MCHGSELTLCWMFMITYWSCEALGALWIRPSCAGEREGAYPCREDMYHIQEGAGGSLSEPRGCGPCGAKSPSALDIFQAEGENANVIIQCLEIGGWCSGDWCFFFSLISSQGQKTRGAEVFLLLVCEWVGGSFVVKNQGLKSTQVRVFSYSYICGGSDRAWQV